MPDVSIQRCIDDGYEVEKVTKDGIPTRYLCINPNTKQKCDTWLYYRGSCRLEATDTQSVPSSGITIKDK
jgi:putative hemolysin